MDTTVISVDSESKEPVRHQLGKTVVGGAAAYVANQLADKAYDKLLAMYRARKA